MWNSRFADAAADRRGTTAVEFAIVAPALLALLFGAFELGWSLHCNQSVDYAVTIATRQLVADPSLSQAQLQSQVQSQLSSIADPSHVTVSLSEDPASAHPQMATVSATYSHTMDVPLLNSFAYTYKTRSTAVLNP